MKLFRLPLTLAIGMMLPVCVAQAQTDDQPVRVPDAPVKIDTSVVGWQEAGLGTNGGRVGKTLRANWVMLNDSSGIDGQIVGISASVDVFLLRNGFVVGRTSTAEDGSFTMESTSPGPYTLVAYSPEAILSFNFNAVANNGAAVGMPLSIQSRPITGRENNKLVAKLINEEVPNVNFPSYGTYDLGQASTDPASLYGWEGLKNLTENAVPATTIRSHSIGILNDGRMVGRVHQTHNRNGRPVEIKSTRILMIQGGVIVSETQVDDMGVFSFEGLSAGEYGLVAVGEDGFLATGIDLVEGGSSSAFSSAEMASNTDARYPYRSVSAQEFDNQGSSIFDATLTSPDSVGWLNFYVTEEAYVQAMNEPRPEFGNANFNNMPFDYFGGDLNGNFAFDDGFGGGFFGGGGGGFGLFGGGLGGFLPLGVGAIIAEAVDDNNSLSNGFLPPPPASPF